MNRIADPWGARTPYARGERWPERVDVNVTADAEHWFGSASVLHSNGDGIDIAVRDGRIIGVRGRAEDRVNRGRLDPKDVYGWQANHSARSADPAAGPRRRPARRVRLGDGDGPDRRPLEGVAGRARRLGPDRLLHHRPAVPGGVLHARGDRQGRDRDAAHGRQHAPVHRDGGGRAEGVVRQRRAARAPIPTSITATRSRSTATTSPRPRPCCGCGCSTGGAARDPPRMLCVDPRATPVAREADIHLAPRAGHEPRADERPPARAAAARLDRRATGSRAHAHRPRGARAHRRRRTRPSACRRSAASSRRSCGRGRADRHRRGADLDRPAGRLSVQPGDRRGVRGQQPPPAARHDRPARRRRVPDERAADRPEHARDRRRRRPPGLSQLEQPRAHPRARRAVERRRGHDPALGAADARHAAVPLRRAGLDPPAVDQRHQPRGLAARSRSDPAHPRAATS